MVLCICNKPNNKWLNCNIETEKMLALLFGEWTDMLCVRGCKATSSRGLRTRIRSPSSKQCCNHAAAIDITIALPSSSRSNGWCGLWVELVENESRSNTANKHLEIIYLCLYYIVSNCTNIRKWFGFKTRTKKFKSFINVKRAVITVWTL